MKVWEIQEVVCGSVDSSRAHIELYETRRARGDFRPAQVQSMISNKSRFSARAYLSTPCTFEKPEINVSYDCFYLTLKLH